MRTYYKNDVLMITDEKKKSITKQSKLIIKNRKTLLKLKLNDDVINIIIVFLYGDNKAFETKFMYSQYVYIIQYNIKFCNRNQKLNHFLNGENSKNKCSECKKYYCDDCYANCFRCLKLLCDNCLKIQTPNYLELLNNPNIYCNPKKFCKRCNKIEEDKQDYNNEYAVNKLLYC